MLNQFKLLALRFDLAVRCDMSRQAWPGFSSRIHQELKMNKDQVKGATKEAAGKVQEAAGKLVGSKEQQAKGLVKQVAGGAQKAYGNAKEAVKDAHK
jgi:uncharacterized protein YjbJ (UPF0337 family)